MPIDDNSDQLQKNYPEVNASSGNTAPAPPSSSQPAAIPDFNFGAAGDWGYNLDSNATARNIADHGAELAILLGDLSYASGPAPINSWWNDEIAPIQGISVAALGNHDDLSSDMMNQYHSLFGLAEKDPNNDWIYSFNHQNVHFLAMNTEASESADSEQYEFVKNDLASAASNADITWIIVFMHKPVYASPTEHGAEPELQKNFHALFDLYGVDLVLSGHNHNYQRTFPLKYDQSDPSSPIIETMEKANYEDPVGQVYVTIGTAGQEHHRLDGKAYFVVTQDDANFGFMDIDIINNGKTMKCTFYTNGDVARDTFTIDKSSDRTVSLPPTSPEAKDILRVGNIAEDAFDSSILRESAAVGWPDPMLIKAQISQESNFNPLESTLGTRWASPCGVKSGWTENESQSFGLFQLTPACGNDEDDMGVYSPETPLAGHPILVSDTASPFWSQSFYNGDFNIHFGLYAMSKHLKHFESTFPGCTEIDYMQMALAAHRTGRPQVSGCGSWTSTAQDYINAVLERYHDFSDETGYPGRM